MGVDWLRLDELDAGAAVQVSVARWIEVDVARARRHILFALLVLLGAGFAWFYPEVKNSLGPFPEVGTSRAQEMRFRAGAIILGLYGVTWLIRAATPVLRGSPGLVLEESRVVVRSSVLPRSVDASRVRGVEWSEWWREPVLVVEPRETGSTSNRLGMPYLKLEEPGQAGVPLLAQWIRTHKV